VKTKIATLALLIASQASYATSVNGVIRDESGMPVAGASVDVVGTHITVRVDAEGRFQLDNPSARNLELHVKAPGFSHTVISRFDGNSGSMAWRVRIPLTGRSVVVDDTCFFD